jgi:uncharacterized protein (TIGR00255 family)
MAQGMTGFGTAHGKADWGSWLWEIRSVNGRALDVRMSLPAGFDAVEFEARRRLKEMFARGSFQAQLKIEYSRDIAQPQIDRRELCRMARIARTFRSPASPSIAVEMLIASPGLSRAPARRPSGSDEDIAEGILASFSEALGELAGARSAEGRALADLFDALLAEIDQLLERANAEAEAQWTLVRDRFLSRVTTFLGPESSADHERFVQEAVLTAARADVREELDRLRAHVVSARRTLGDAGPVGRKLDFLLQEFNREANTLCSKSASLELTDIGLSLKTRIDQLREQVQNVE